MVELRKMYPESIPVLFWRNNASSMSIELSYLHITIYEKRINHLAPIVIKSKHILKLRRILNAYRNT